MPKMLFANNLGTVQLLRNPYAGKVAYTALADPHNSPKIVGRELSYGQAKAVALEWLSSLHYDPDTGIISEGNQPQPDT